MVEVLAEPAQSDQHRLPSSEGVDPAPAEAAEPRAEADILRGRARHAAVAALERQISFHEQEIEEIGRRKDPKGRPFAPEVVAFQTTIHRRQLERHVASLASLGEAEVVPIYS